MLIINLNIMYDGSLMINVNALVSNLSTLIKVVKMYVSCMVPVVFANQILPGHMLLQCSLNRPSHYITERTLVHTIRTVNLSRIQYFQLVNDTQHESIFLCSCLTLLSFCSY